MRTKQQAKVASYRAVVVATTPCPLCGAAQDQKCRRADTSPENELGYVHDDRSADHYLNMFGATLNSLSSRRPVDDQAADPE